MGAGFSYRKFCVCGPFTEEPTHKSKILRS